MAVRLLLLLMVAAVTLSAAPGSAATEGPALDSPGREGARGDPEPAEGPPARALTLGDCIALAFQTNPSLLIAHQGVVLADAELRRATSSYYPSATFIATQGRTAGSSFVETAGGTVAFSASGRRREAEVLLSQTIWQTGRGESVRAARRSVDAAMQGENAAAQELILTVSRLYYQCLAAEQLVGVADANLTAARDHEKLVKARATVGESAPVDVAPAEADVADAELSLLRAGNDVEIAKANLKKEIGVPMSAAIQLAPLPSPGRHAGEQETDLPASARSLSAAIANRPDLAEMRARTAAAEDALRSAREVQRGVLTLGAQYDRGLQGPQEGASWAATLSASIPLFDSGGRRADVQAAEARLASLRAQERGLTDTISLEIETAILNADTARRSIQAASKAVASAEAQLAAAEGKY